MGSVFYGLQLHYKNCLPNWLLNLEAMIDIIKTGILKKNLDLFYILLSN